MQNNPTAGVLSRDPPSPCRFGRVLVGLTVFKISSFVWMILKRCLKSLDLDILSRLGTIQPVYRETRGCLDENRETPSDPLTFPCFQLHRSHFWRTLFELFVKPCLQAKVKKFQGTRTKFWVKFPIINLFKMRGRNSREKLGPSLG